MTKKFLQRSHLVLLQVKHPADGNVIDSCEPFLHLEGARISLRFLDLRNDEIMEFGGKSKLQHLNPINLSEQVLSEDQTKLLRKGPSFCPAPRDINWQEVRDDLEAFEARLRTAVFFMEKDPEEPASNVHSQNHLPPIPGKKGWKPPISKFPELELFLSNVRKDILNPRYIRNSQDNLSKGERSALRELKNSEVTIRIQDKGSRFALINSNEYNNKMLG